MATFADAFLVGQGARQVSNTPIVSVGTRIRTLHGRIYRYIRAASGGSAILPGTIVSSPVPRADLPLTQPLTSVTAPIRVGDTVLQLTLPGSVVGSVLANEYAGGLLSALQGAIYTSGRDYVIDSHTGGVAGQVITVRLPPDDAFDIDNLVSDAAWFTLTYNPYNGVAVLNGVASGPALGVANTYIGPSQYAWVQSGGICAVKTTGALAAGALAYPTGAAGNASATGTQIAGMAPIGCAINTGAAGGVQSIFLTIE